MDFTLTANANGPADPNNIMLRGADPLYSLPAAHPLRRAGLKLQTTPGGLNASLDNALASEVEAALIPALRPDAALRGSVSFCVHRHRRSYKPCYFSLERNHSPTD